MNWLIGIAFVVFVYVVIPPGMKVNFVCGTFENVVSLGKSGVESATDLSVNINRSTSVIALPDSFTKWQNVVSVSCREKTRRFVAFSDNLEQNRYREAIMAGRVKHQEKPVQGVLHR